MSTSRTPNEKRAAFGGAALLTYMDHVRCDEGIDALYDLIADLGHFAEIEGYDFLEIVERAVTHWLAERHGESAVNPKTRAYIVLGGRS